MITFISPIRVNGLRPAISLPEGWGTDETHVTKIQEITCQYVLVPELSLLLVNKLMICDNHRETDRVLNGHK